MKKRKLGILYSSSYTTSYGGVGPFIRNLDPTIQNEFDVDYVKLPSRIQKIEFVPRRLLFLAYLTLYINRLNKYEVILSHEPEASFVASFTKVPFVHIFHGNANAMSGSRFWYGRYFSWVFNFFVRRIFKKAILIYTVGSLQPCTRKILNPISHNVKIKEIEQRNGFIFTGRLEKLKNIDRLLEIYACLPHTIKDRHPFFIAGYGSQCDFLKAYVKTLNIEHYVIFLGTLDNKSVIEKVSNTKVLIMASTSEGFPMAIAEALSVGVPVISTDVGDISSVVKDHYNGFILPSNFRNEHYSECIETILDNYRQFAENAAESSQVFNANKIALDLSNTIKENLPKL